MWFVSLEVSMTCLLRNGVKIEGMGWWCTIPSLEGLSPHPRRYLISHLVSLVADTVPFTCIFLKNKTYLNKIELYLLTSKCFNAKRFKKSLIHSRRYYTFEKNPNTSFCPRNKNNPICLDRL